MNGELREGDLIVLRDQSYRIVRELGCGGLGTVYKVHATDLGPAALYACKVMKLPPDVPIEAHENLLNALMREAKHATSIRHDNVVRVFSAQVDDSRPHRHLYCLLMELLEGETLEDRLREQGPLSLDEVCAIMLPIMDGVALLHEKGLTHRDIKPANIFLARQTDGTVRPTLLDFGISHSRSPEITQISGSGLGPGTPGYMSRPQLLNEPPKARFDVHALGVVLYGALRGVLPFGAIRDTSAALKALEQTPTALTECVPDLDKRVWKLVERTICERSPSPIVTVDVLRRELAATRTKRRPFGTITAALVIATTLAILYWSWLEPAITAAEGAAEAGREPVDMATAPQPAPPPSRANPAHERVQPERAPLDVTDAQQSLERVPVEVSQPAYTERASPPAPKPAIRSKVVRVAPAKLPQPRPVDTAADAEKTKPHLSKPPVHNPARDVPMPFSPGTVAKPYR